MQILKVIGLLMEYPDELLWECKEDALALIRRDAPMLTDFTHNLLNAPLLDKQAEWCEVFDRGRTTSLLLFEHVHAESRDRGQAMVDLLAGASCSRASNNAYHGASRCFKRPPSRARIGATLSNPSFA